MENKILELTQDILGRRKIKVVLHEIYPNRLQWNHNGITYLEQYTRDNADSVKGMPLCAEFLDDDKDIPYGHGLTGSKGNLSLFENSVQVGTCESWSIEDIEIDGEKHRCLCATGYINENRYPNFVKWLEKQIESGNPVYGSIEFVGTKDNDGEIIYDGGWKEEGRIPMVYDYIGYSLISISPADDSALVTAFDRAKGEFDDVFGSIEKNDALTDDWGFLVEESRPKDKEKMNKAEFDRCIVAGLLKEENNNIDFDVFADKIEKMTKTEYDDLIAWSLENESKCDNSDENFENVFE